ncbi:heavy metal-binding domain-containing protein [Sphingomonas abietis]|uniref:Heavy metal-binding domain-containing protein n=1 Tax=Sphingomonas abietis TaxID=3012344 RepID=A0ABY7NI54_9SPHN|nr:heavy metal-binding domain-containing protein [Sphingomonas abietis]WBO21018.1 heavy metal-binding domain-containing protein [Sphingomonas abietis]
MALFSREPLKTRTTEDHEARARAWEEALDRQTLPAFVTERLQNAAIGRQPWVATMTPAELLLAKSHGVKPIATVSGTCWFHYGWSWTEGHEEGWHHALNRIKREAHAAGANAVVDVRMRTLRHSVGPSMDFTLIGTAIRVEGLPASPDPVVATVPALEFVRLLEMGIVPVGIAVGARYDWLGNVNGNGWGGSNGWSANSWGGQTTQWQTGLFAGNQPLTELGQFWEGIRRDAHAALRSNAATMGNGVLAHTHFGQILRREQDKQPPAYLGRHIVVGTVVDTPRGAGVPHDVEPVIDMRDGLSPLKRTGEVRHAVYDTDAQEQEGSI